MDKKLILFVIGALLLVGIGISGLWVNSEDSSSSEIKTVTGEVYQGPIPEGYDEEHFRRTGETIKKIEVLP